MAADQPQQEASTSAAKAAQDASKGEEDAKKTLPQLGALEEDDEFEEVSLRQQGLHGSQCMPAHHQVSCPSLS